MAFVDRLRGMVAFESVEALVEQMHDDVDRARELLALTRPRQPAEPLARAETWFLAARPALLRARGADRGPRGAATRPHACWCWSASLPGRRPAPAVALALVTDESLPAPAVLAHRRPARGALVRPDRAARPADPGWALRRTSGACGCCCRCARALPLLLLFVTFLFINTEVWQVARTSTAACCGSPSLLFGALAVGFLLVRLPEEVDRFDDDVDDGACVRLRGHAARARPRAGRRPDATRRRTPRSPASRRWNLVLVLLIVQVVQVLLLSLSVFVFFMLFGALVMETDDSAWLDRRHLAPAAGALPPSRASWCRCRSSWRRSPGST